MKRLLYALLLIPALADASKISQKITVGPIPKIVVAGTGTVSATSTSHLTVTFSSITPLVCTISGTTVTSLTAGRCVIEANQIGDATYQAAVRGRIPIEIPYTAQTITFGTVPTLTQTSSPALITATASSNLPVILTSLKTETCTIDKTGLITPLAAGNCNIQATQEGNNIFGVAPKVVQTIVIPKQDQTITFGTAPTLSVGVKAPLLATTTSNIPIKFKTTTAPVCLVRYNEVIAKTVGTCTVQADADYNSNFNKAPSVTQTIQVTKGSQTLTFTEVPSPVVGQTVRVNAVSSEPHLPITYGTTTPNVCTNVAEQVTALIAGTCTVTANQPGDTNYNAATQITQALTVAKAGQLLKVVGKVPTIAMGQTGTLTVVSNVSNLIPTIGTTTPTICTVSGNVITGVLAGPCVITADQPGDDNHTAAIQLLVNLTVGKTPQTITFGTAPSVNVGTTGTVTATASSSLPVTLTSVTPSQCTIDDKGVVTGKGAGKCGIVGSQLGNDVFDVAPKVPQVIVVGKGDQTITLTPPTDLKVGKQELLVGVTSASLKVYYLSTTKNICTISGPTVTGKAAGSCIINVNQAGNQNYNAAPQVSATFNILDSSIPPGPTKTDQTLALDVTPVITVGSSAPVHITSSAGLPVLVIAAPPSVCTSALDTTDPTANIFNITGVSAGTCSIIGNQNGTPFVYGKRAIVGTVIVTGP